MNFIIFVSYCLVFMPMLAAIFVGMLTQVLSARLSQIITTTASTLSAICSIIIFFEVVINKHNIHIQLFEWISTAHFHTNWTIYIDTLTSLMLVLVTTISSLVHMYSIGYMSHDEHKQRFMAYLSLFTFCMISLVTADNFLQIFFGWEGVGFCSYLLIGFWYQKPEANNAAMKAFIVNRVGDFALILGIATLFWYTDSVVFSDVFAQIPAIADSYINILGYDVNIVTMACLLLLIGAMGKSAQIGLHVWLPDAMEGPTPVSALIHAATMVTAGVFLIARCSPIFEFSSFALMCVACVGIFTCLFAASIALVQNDIKRIIAYSTCSQLGYMFFACGISVYSAAIFHLLTHGFFKALLFLAAGSVIHATGEQDIRKMGNLYSKLPFTYIVTWIGSLALAGIFPFAGFYSKDIILESAIASSSNAGTFGFIIGLLVAVLTALYSFKIIIMVFHGSSNSTSTSHIHEPSMSMKIPLILLAIGSICTGYLGDKVLQIVDPTLKIWNESIKVLSSHDSIANIGNIDHIYSFMPLFAGISGIMLAYISYSFAPQLRRLTMAKLHKIYTLLINKCYFDEIYHHLFVLQAKNLGKLMFKSDVNFIDAVPNKLATFTNKLSTINKEFHNGLINRYSFVMALGLAALLYWTIFLMQ